MADDIGKVEQGGVRMLHVDIMDGHFVPNLTIGPPVVKSIRKATKLTLDVHLMITDPDKFAPLFVDAGADQISVHYEAATHLDRTIRLIQANRAFSMRHISAVPEDELIPLIEVHMRQVRASLVAESKPFGVGNRTVHQFIRIQRIDRRFPGE